MHPCTHKRNHFEEGTLQCSPTSTSRFVSGSRRAHGQRWQSTVTISSDYKSQLQSLHRHPKHSRLYIHYMCFARSERPVLIEDIETALGQPASTLSWTPPPHPPQFTSPERMPLHALRCVCLILIPNAPCEENDKASSPTPTSPEVRIMLFPVGDVKMTHIRANGTTID